MATNTQTMATGHSSAIEQALHKIDTVDVSQGKHIALAYSGGLDSTLCVKLSQLKYHARKLTAITVDVGQGEAEIGESSERAKKLGISPLVIDARQEFTEQWLSKAIQANSDYNGYPVSTSMTRQLIAAHVAQKADLQKKQVTEVLDQLLALAVKEVKNVFVLPNFGRLVLANRKARMGRNPQTGEAIKIPAKRVVRFRLAKSLKDAVLGKK